MSNDGTPKLWMNGGFETVFHSLKSGEAAEAPASDGDWLIDLAEFIADPELYQDRLESIGIRIPAGSDIEPLLPYLEKLPLIALDFSSFADGRNYSTARLLRERHAYGGELRAIGDVLIDQIPLMRRCGIDTFVVTHIPTQNALREGRIPEVKYYYQPAGGNEIPTGTRPWTRLPVDAPAR